MGGGTCDGPCDGHELSPYRGGAHSRIQELERINGALVGELDRIKRDGLDLSRYRVAVQATASMTVYSAVAALSSKAFLDHPGLAAFLVSANLLVWAAASLIRRLDR